MKMTWPQLLIVDDKQFVRKLSSKGTNGKSHGILFFICYYFTVQVLKVCRTPGPSACSKTKMLQLLFLASLFSTVNNPQVIYLQLVFEFLVVPDIKGFYSDHFRSKAAQLMRPRLTAIFA